MACLWGVNFKLYLFVNREIDFRQDVVGDIRPTLILFIMEDYEQRGATGKGLGRFSLHIWE